MVLRDDPYLDNLSTPQEEDFQLSMKNIYIFLRICTLSLVIFSVKAGHTRSHCLSPRYHRSQELWSIHLTHTPARAHYTHIYTHYDQVYQIENALS